MNKLLSIVIPVYKVEQYINKCLDSLLIFKLDGKRNKVIDDKLMSMMDVLIINDGTPDKSADLSREYVKRYPQYFRQIDKENGGHGSVWNMGVELAEGKYIKFLDSDDWLENLDKFLIKLQATDSDLILTPVKDHCKDDEVWRSSILDMEFYTSYDADSFDWLGNRTHNYLLHHMCCYKAEVFRQYMPGLFLEKQPYDDVVLWPAAMIGGRSIEAFDFPVYNYLMDRPGQSISPEMQKRNRWSVIKTAKHTIEFYETHPVKDGTTKAAFIASKLPKAYSSKYYEFVLLPCREGKALLKDWDTWARKLNPEIGNVFVKMYRALPYCIYYPLCKLGLFVLGLRRKKETGPARYVQENS